MALWCACLGYFLRICHYLILSVLFCIMYFVLFFAYLSLFNFVFILCCWCSWLGGRKGIQPVKTEWWGTGVVICLARGADLHMATVSCFSKIQIRFTFLVATHLGSPGKRADKRTCVCVRVCVCVLQICADVCGIGCVGLQYTQSRWSYDTWHELSAVIHESSRLTDSRLVCILLCSRRCCIKIL